MTPLSSLIHRVNNFNRPLDILCVDTHERYETSLAKTGHNFYTLPSSVFEKAGYNVVKWKEYQTPFPKNRIRLQENIPLHMDFDLVLTQNKFGQYQVLSKIAHSYNIPLVSIEHTLPVPNWPPGSLTQFSNMRGRQNVFICEYQLGEWEWNDNNDTAVIHHAIDSELFKPTLPTRDPIILSVVNDWINRDYACNFQGWRRITNGLPTRVIGNTPGLSKAANSVEELSNAYASSLIFLNTSVVSPIPMSLLEAMSSGCCPISTATCMIPDIIENGKNGFISNDENELKYYLEDMLAKPESAKQIGLAARRTIKELFSEKRFIEQWNRLLYKAAECR